MRIMPESPEDSIQLLYLRLVEDLTPWHLRILRLLDDPRRFLANVGKTPPGFMASSIGRVITTAYPELESRREIYDLIGRELFASGLTNTASFHTTMTADGAVDRRTTVLGRSFVQYITDPTPEQL